METRVFTRRRFFYTINEVQQLVSVSQSLLSLALAAVCFALGLPQRLLRFAPLLLCLASQNVLIALEAMKLTLRRSSQREETYPQRTWRDYSSLRDCRADFRFSPGDMPRLIAALELPPSAKAKGYTFTADEAVSVLLLTLASNASLLKVNQKFGIKRARASAILAWTMQWMHDRWYKPLFVTDFHRWAPHFSTWADAVHRKQGGGGGSADQAPSLDLTRALALRQPRVLVVGLDVVLGCRAQALLELECSEVRAAQECMRAGGGNAPTPPGTRPTRFPAV